MIKTKKSVDAGVAAQATFRTFGHEIHPSFRRLEEERILTEFKESVAQVWEGPQKFPGVGPNNTVLNESVDSAKNNGRSFETPDGWNKVFRAERFSVVEGLFDSSAILSVSCVLLFLFSLDMSVWKSRMRY